MPIRVLLVEDDIDFRESLESFLNAAGFEVRAIGDADSLDAELANHRPDVVVLDVNLPGMDGFSVATTLRSTSNLGLVMLTGRKDRQDRFQGLAIGVDHYLTKPIDPAELELVVRNLHRRLHAHASGTPAPSSDRWILDTAHWMLTSPNGMQVTLSRQEYEVLGHLMARPGSPVSRTELMRKDDRDADDSGRGLDLIIFRLRRRMERECGCPLPVRSVRSIGYVFSHGSTVR